MQIAEFYIQITTLIIDILALIASIGVGVAIFWLQLRHEKSIVKKDLINEARLFLLDNEEELEYLVLAQIASAKQSTRKISSDGSGKYKQKRRLYKQFHQCPNSLRKEVIRQARIRDYQLEKYNINELIDRMIDLFEKDAQELGLLGKRFLYDGAKYFHRGLDRYGNFNICHIEGVALESAIWHHLLNFISYKNEEKKESAFTSFLNSTTGPWAVKRLYPSIKSIEEYTQFFGSPPLDYYWTNYASQVEIPESQTTFVVMEMIRQSAIMINREKYKLDDEGFDYPDPRTYEDLYYGTFLELYRMYKNRINHMKNRTDSVEAWNNKELVVE